MSSTYLPIYSIEQLIHFQNTGRKLHQKSLFTKDEDDKLKMLVEEFGEQSWNLISQHMNRRNQRQCKDRWYNYLSPNINNDPWTKEEDSLLDNLVMEHGTKWSKISPFFPNRTSINVRSRYLVMQRKKKRVNFEPSYIGCIETSNDHLVEQSGDLLKQISGKQINLLESSIMHSPEMPINNHEFIWNDKAEEEKEIINNSSVDIQTNDNCLAIDIKPDADCSVIDIQPLIDSSAIDIDPSTLGNFYFNDDIEGNIDHDIPLLEDDFNFLFTFNQ